MVVTRKWASLIVVCLVYIHEVLLFVSYQDRSPNHMVSCILYKKEAIVWNLNKNTNKSYSVDVFYLLSPKIKNYMIIPWPDTVQWKVFKI